MDSQMEAIVMLAAGIGGALFILGTNALAFRIQQHLGWTDKEGSETSD
jgi:hypothetical protein